MHFRSIEKSDRELFASAVGEKTYLACEYRFAHLFLWKDSDGIRIASDGTDLFFKESRVGCFMAPVSDDPVRALDKLAAHCQETGDRFLVCSGYQELADALEGNPVYRVEHDRTYDDYVYRASDLIDLPGKAYHGKRGHIAKFSRTHCYSFAPYTDADRKACMQLEEEWVEHHGFTHTTLAEQQAIETALTHLDFLGMSGGCLRVNGKLAAFTVGQRADRQMGIVHFEKCAPGMEEAYPVINQAYAAMAFEGLTYINRQDDMGLPGLRRAKEQYHPVTMAKKYTITLREDEPPRQE